jgi:hypothetical protein
VILGQTDGELELSDGQFALTSLQVRQSLLKVLFGLLLRAKVTILQTVVKGHECYSASAQDQEN